MPLYEGFVLVTIKLLRIVTLNSIIATLKIREMKKFSTYIIAAIVLMMFSSGCAVNSGTVSNTVSQAGTMLAQTAAYQSAKLTVDKWAAQIGFTPQQTAQVLPMVQEYFTAVGTAVVNTNGSASQKATAAKNALVAKLKTVLTTSQVTKAVSQL